MKHRPKIKQKRRKQIHIGKKYESPKEEKDYYGYLKEREELK